MGSAELFTVFTILFLCIILCIMTYAIGFEVGSATEKLVHEGAGGTVQGI